MSYSKQQFVSFALEEIGYANYIFDIMPEQTESVLRTLDAMMANWDARGIKLGYPLIDNPSYSNITSDTGVPDSANEAIVTNLAVKIGPRFGKTIPQELKQSAKTSYDNLLILLTTPRPMDFPTILPIGQGNKPWLRPCSSVFISPPCDSITDADNGAIDLF